MVRNQNTHHFGIQSPKKGGDVGYDLVVSTDFSLPPHGQSSAAFIIPAGVHIKAPEGFWCMIVGRSSAARRGIDVQTAIIDNGYVGELFACCWNMTNKAILVKRGEKIAQAVFMPACTFPMKEVCELPPTERGGTGFGSTGK